MRCSLCLRALLTSVALGVLCSEPKLETRFAHNSRFARAAVPLELRWRQVLRAPQAQLAPGAFVRAALLEAVVAL